MNKIKDDVFDIKPKHALFVIIIFAFFSRCIIGMFYKTPIDIIDFNIPWALEINQSFFKVYSVSENLNYPPLFPSLLWFVSGAVKVFVEKEIIEFQMLFIKLVPIIFDCMNIVVLYFLGKRYSEKMAIILASVWALNVSAVFNSAFWGQTDSLMMFWIALMVIAFEDEKPTLATVFFALGCLTKLQMAYFAPIVILELYFNYKPLKATKSLLIGLGAGILGWLPFMLGSSRLMLPFDIYLGGFDSYNYINLYAFNFYGFFENSYMSADRSILFGNIDEYTGLKMGGLTYNRLSMIFTVGIVLALVVSYVLAKKNSYKISTSLNAMMLINSIFMLSTKMHERYQISVVILLIISFVTCKNAKFFKAFVASTIITFFNQSLALFGMTANETLKDFFVYSKYLFSVLNIILFVYLLVAYIQYHVEQIKLSNKTINKIS